MKILKSWQLPRAKRSGASGGAGAILLAYREKSSFFAVGQRLGLHHQTVQRCVERALADGPLTALDDRPRPGKEPTITPEAKAWLVSLACDKAKIMVIRTNCGRRGCWHAMRARMRRPSSTNVSPKWCRERCARYSAKRKSSRTRYVLSGTSRRRVRAEDGGGSVRLSRGPGAEEGCQISALSPTLAGRVLTLCSDRSLSGLRRSRRNGSKDNRQPF
jgi:hypothetical protein